MVFFVQVTPQDGLVTPPLWRLRADLFKKRPKSLKNRSFARFFHEDAQLGCKSRKTGFYVFCLFTPLDRRFSLSHALQTIDLEEIYRLVSKILHFMASGSVLKDLLKFYRNSIENLWKFYRNSIDFLSKLYRNSTEVLLQFC